MTGATTIGVIDCSVKAWPGPHTTRGGASGTSTTNRLTVITLLVCTPSYTWKEMERSPAVGSMALFV